MSVDQDRLIDEGRRAWRRVTGNKPCTEGLRSAGLRYTDYGNAILWTNELRAMSMLTGARFDCCGISHTIPTLNHADTQGCAEALIAQWEGLDQKAADDVHENS